MSKKLKSFTLGYNDYYNDRVMMQKIYYTIEEEKWNTWSHAVGVVLGVVCCYLFVSYSIEHHTPLATFSLILYFTGMLASYISSTTYHALPPLTNKKLILRKIDHAAIYWHIAGSYSPLTLIALRHEALWGWGLFTFIWIIALAGTVLSFYKLRDHSNVETVTFVGMGLSVFVAFKPLLASVEKSVILWIILEGVMYITGAVFYTIHKRRYMHTIFHFFVLLGTVCHLMAVWCLLRG